MGSCSGLPALSYIFWYWKGGDSGPQLLGMAVSEAQLHLPSVVRPVSSGWVGRFCSETLSSLFCSTGPQCDTYTQCSDSPLGD